MISFHQEDENQNNQNTPLNGDPTLDAQNTPPADAQSQPAPEAPKAQDGSYSYSGGQIPDPRFQMGSDGQVPFGYAFAQEELKKKKKKKKKEKKGVSRAGLCITLVFCILLSGVAGFVGTTLAFGTVQEVKTKTVEKTAVVYRVPTQDNTPIDPNNANVEVAVTNRAAAAVVEITTETMVTSSFYGQYVESGAGSGVIISADGYIITCDHVVSGATTVTVKLTTGDSYKATVVGSDSQTDIAVLKIDVTELPYVVLGDSDALQVGEVAVAIGNPLGSLGGTVTSGIISALDRKVQIDGQSYNLLQTSAAINPGNSGGGLFNANGELIGIVNAKSSGENIEGLGFAIPINDGMEIAEQLMSYGYVKGRPALGVMVLEISENTDVWSLRNSEYAAILNYATEYGVYFLEYQDGQSGDLRFGDRFVAINGVTVSNQSALRSALSEYKVGDTITVTVARIEDITSRNPRSVMVDVKITLIELVNK